MKSSLKASSLTTLLFCVALTMVCFLDPLRLAFAAEADLLREQIELQELGVKQASEKAALTQEHSNSPIVHVVEAVPSNPPVVEVSQLHSSDTSTQNLEVQQRNAMSELNAKPALQTEEMKLNHLKQRQAFQSGKKPHSPSYTLDEQYGRGQSYNQNPEHGRTFHISATDTEGANRPQQQPERSPFEQGMKMEEGRQAYIQQVSYSIDNENEKQEAQTRTRANYACV